MPFQVTIQLLLSRTDDWHRQQSNGSYLALCRLILARTHFPHSIRRGRFAPDEGRGWADLSATSALSRSFLAKPKMIRCRVPRTSSSTHRAQSLSRRAARCAPSARSSPDHARPGSTRQAAQLAAGRDGTEERLGRGVQETQRAPQPARDRQPRSLLSFPASTDPEPENECWHLFNA